MFGNAPKALWTRWMPADERNRIDLACRTLLIDEGPRKVLLEAGVGAFFEPKLADRFGIQEQEHVLLGGLAELGLSHRDIDVVVLSHLHFDHAGGLLSSWSPDSEPELLFPRARIVVGRRQWARACSPHARDRASFVPRLNTLLADCGRMELVDSHSEVLGEGYRLHFSEGHTVGLMLTELDTPEGPLVFAADLVPGVPWVHAPITMGYDRFPEILVDEKTKLLGDLVERGGSLFFTHDPRTAAARIHKDERSRFTTGEAWL
ncbi:MAG TPA: MBL fold metallo-hydrolase [Myxococcota bacterium]|nr:MBL fold metallo-hydrolase [Myxococcota bacterium]